MSIHPTAIVAPGAEIDPSVEIGPYAVVESGARIDADTRLWQHACVLSGARIGRRCQIHPFAVIGGPPQDRKFEGAPSYVRIGDDAIIREGVTVHRGTLPESETVVGPGCFLMAGAHVGHNCHVGRDVVIANTGLLAGHVYVGDRAFISGSALCHQFIRIGELAMLQGGARVTMDVPPFMTFCDSRLTSANVIGMRRAGFSDAERAEIRDCFRILYRSGLLFRDAVERVAASVRTDPGRRLVEFLRAPSRRGVAGARRGGPREQDDA